MAASAIRYLSFHFGTGKKMPDCVSMFYYLTCLKLLMLCLCGKRGMKGGEEVGRRRRLDGLRNEDGQKLDGRREG
jgi:hypothetical protein